MRARSKLTCQPTNKAGTGVSLRLKTSTPAPDTNPYGTKEPDGYSYYSQ